MTSSVHTLTDLHCTLSYSQTLAGVTNLTLSQELTAVDTLEVDIKIGAFVTAKAKCAICGDKCEIKALGSTVAHFQLPPCPLKSGAVNTPFSLALPKKNPLPIDAKFHGTVSLKAGKTSLVSLEIDGEF